jgi:hypothetical protein
MRVANPPVGLTCAVAASRAARPHGHRDPRRAAMYAISLVHRSSTSVTGARIARRSHCEAARARLRRLAA